MTTIDVSWADASRTLLVVRRDGAVLNVPADTDNTDFAIIAAAIDLDALPTPPPAATGPMPGALAAVSGPGMQAPGPGGAGGQLWAPALVSPSPASEGIVPPDNQRGPAQ